MEEHLAQVKTTLLSTKVKVKVKVKDKIKDSIFIQDDDSDTCFDFKKKTDDLSLAMPLCYVCNSVRTYSKICNECRDNKIE